MGVVVGSFYRKVLTQQGFFDKMRGKNLIEVVISMICWYSYMKMNGEEFGDYQCDFEDFKKFFNSRDDLRCVYLVKGDKRFIWSRNNRDLNNDGRIRGFGGWMFVGKVK